MKTFYYNTSDVEFSHDGWAYVGSEAELMSELRAHAECMRHGFAPDTMPWKASDYLNALKAIDLDDLLDADDSEISDALRMARKWDCGIAQAALETEQKRRG